MLDLAEQPTPRELLYAPGDWSIIDGQQIVKMHYEPDGPDRGELTRTLVELTVDDEAGIAKAIDELHDRDLVTTSTTVELTTQGKTLFQQISATKTDLQKQLYDGIPAEDLTITNRVLDLITERARVARGTADRLP